PIPSSRIAGNPRKAGCRAIDTSPWPMLPSPGTSCRSLRHPTAPLLKWTPPVARGAPRRPVRRPSRSPAAAPSMLDVLDGRGAAVAAGLVLDHDEPGAARHPAHPPLAGHVPPEGHHHAAVAHDDDVVPTCAGSRTVERRARAGRDLDQRLAARRAPEPVALRVVVAHVAQRRVGLPGQLAVRLLAQV